MLRRRKSEPVRKLSKCAYIKFSKSSNFCCMLMVVFVVKHFPMIGVEPSDLNNIVKLSQCKLSVKLNQMHLPNSSNILTDIGTALPSSRTSRTRLLRSLFRRSLGASPRLPPTWRLLRFGQWWLSKDNLEGYTLHSFNISICIC